MYRLISEKTIEENILKKANQKRILSDVTIEGGNFTTAFFRQNTIQELFEEPAGNSLIIDSGRTPYRNSLRNQQVIVYYQAQGGSGFVLSMDYLEKYGIQLSIFKVMNSMKFGVVSWILWSFVEIF